MRPAGLGIECGLGLPVDPSDIVLLRGHEQRFREGFLPGAQYLTRDPSMGQLADGEIAGRLAAKQHEEKLIPRLADRMKQIQIPRKSRRLSTP